MKKAALHNLGCKVNAYETEAMQELLENCGYEIVPFQEYADVYIINTCSVTNMADRKSRQMIHRARKENPGAVIVAAGCYVQTEEAQAKEDGAADILIGNNRKHELPQLLEQYFSEQRKQEAVTDINDGVQPFEPMALGKTAEHTRAFIKVQDGCNQFCSYCIIPYARGRARSRDTEEITAEVRNLAEQGYREVVLTGIHLSSFGKDTGDSLLALIRRINEIPGIDRIRLGSLEPGIITEEFAREIAGMEKVCPHFHLSLQSGAADTLKRMNRHYTPEEYLEKCRLLRKYYEHPAITTDVIVGFPGETEAEFEETKAFLEKIRFYEMHIFKYSRRKGTRAAVMENQVDEQTKSKRSNELIALGAQMSEEFRKWYVGKEVTALLEEPYECEGEQYFTGFTREYVRVLVPAEGHHANELVSGEIAGHLKDEFYLMCFHG